MQLTDIFCYPIKGLTPERLSQVSLKAHQPLPWDRKYALIHRNSLFDPDNPRWMKRNNFVVVALNPKLATIKSRLDDETGLFHITDKYGQEHKLYLDRPEHHMQLCSIVETYTGTAQAVPYKLVKLEHGHLADRQENSLSIHNTKSLKAIEKSTGLKISKRRWRGNLWFDGITAFEELSWIGHEISIGTVRLRVTERIERCAATSANIKTGDRDINMPAHLYKTYGHRDFGILAEIIRGGTITTGDVLATNNTHFI